MDHMNHMAKEITWQEKSHGKRIHMAREITWQEKSHGKKTNGKGEKESEARDGSSSCCSVHTILFAFDECGRSVLRRVAHNAHTGETVRLALGQCVQFGPVHLTDCHDKHAKDEALQERVKSHLKVKKVCVAKVGSGVSSN